MRKWLARKIRKVYPENRHFKDEWTDQYLFILPQGSTKPLLRLLCVETVALIKSGNSKRHYESIHRSFEEKHPQKSEVRAWIISELRAQYARSMRVFTHSFTGQQHANECSLKIAWMWGNIKKFQ